MQTLRLRVLAGPDAGRRQVAESESLTIGTAQGNDLVLTDETVSRFHVELSRAKDGVLLVDTGSTNGVFIGTVRLERAVVPAGAVVRLGRTEVVIGDGDSVRVELHKTGALGALRGHTPVMRRLFAQIEKVAPKDVAVLLSGESGTGKELVARALHSLGPRANKPFVTIDCGALAPTLVASELFGHERGAFTGADRVHVGAFEQAQGGTVFLDEIGELPTSLQATLLGVLERRTFRRLGGRQEIKLDVRVVSATNRDLRAEVNTESFRLDLYYRLAVVTLKIAPLRDRLDDIPLLVEQFLRESGCDDPIESLISETVMDGLRAHRWPGNVRELRNLIEATVATGEAPPLEDERAGTITVDTAMFDPILGLTYKEARGLLLTAFELTYLRRLLDRAGGNVSKAARQAGMDRSHLIDLIARHNLR